VPKGTIDLLKKVFEMPSSNTQYGDHLDILVLNGGSRFRGNGTVM